MTFEVQQTCKFQGDKGDMISFDPGSKILLTYHSPQGTWGEIGSFKNQEILLKKVDSLRSRLDMVRRRVPGGGV